MTGTPKMGDKWWKKEEMLVKKKMREPEEDFDGDIFVSPVKNIPGDVFVSPSREYVVYARYKYDPSKEFSRRVTLPESYENNELEAVKFFTKFFDANYEVTNCLSYEQYENFVVGKYLEGRIAIHTAKSDLLGEVKTRLANFFLIERPIADSEVLTLLAKLESDNLIYQATLTAINRDLKIGMTSSEKRKAVFDRGRK